MMWIPIHQTGFHKMKLVACFYRSLGNCLVSRSRSRLDGAARCALALAGFVAIAMAGVLHSWCERKGVMNGAGCTRRH